MIINEGYYGVFQTQNGPFFRTHNNYILNTTNTDQTKRYDLQKKQRFFAKTQNKAIFIFRTQNKENP